ncbi:molecular chaperone Hsp20 [Hydrangea phyllody phytoplasma]|uniref:Molecular chaperone Hsp20 n=2 Tax=16SrI (Aster yellows group) TaxID=3042590 RepID=A0ABQ5PSH7_9MOLU|nr:MULTISPECIES: Hsp20/alpha crystallin family protein [16SrI (Aster yellows group)]GFZ75515.1 molecular chaperone Hsp20 [Hydrangea phyllody phytoplasma]GLH61259.1 molecular chaperone Hsp20 [Rhus yellows phytoplasma]GLH62034.1 molecular chaperone Hsp20 [Hydrangea phyllody phytoplasma]
MLFSLINQNQDLLENLFEDFKTNSLTNNNNIMKTDIQEQDNQYLITIELPGFKKEDVKVALEEGYLVVEAKNSKKNEIKEANFIRKERFQGFLRRSFYLGDDFLLEDIKGSLEQGLLKLSVPKKEVKPKEKHYIKLN